MKTKRNMLWLGITVALALLATGCGEDPGSGGPPVLTSPFITTGGGWIKSAACVTDPCKKKATFGFNMHFLPNEIGTPPTIKGQFQYTDHGEWMNYAKVSFHGVPESLSVEGNVYEGEGSYTPQPKTLGPGGTFVVHVEDLGQSGPSTSDYISITLYDGVFNGYSNAGNLKGGNIQAHVDEDE